MGNIAHTNLSTLRQKRALQILLCILLVGIACVPSQGVPKILFVRVRARV